MALSLSYYRFVFISMDALDQLLVACHSHSLNLFVESFLKMVQKLLESDDPELQVLATQSVGYKNYFKDTIMLQLEKFLQCLKDGFSSCLTKVFGQMINEEKTKM